MEREAWQACAQFTAAAQSFGADRLCGALFTQLSSRHTVPGGPGSPNFAARATAVLKYTETTESRQYVFVLIVARGHTDLMPASFQARLILTWATSWPDTDMQLQRMT